MCDRRTHYETVITSLRANTIITETPMAFDEMVSALFNEYFGQHFLVQ